MNVPPCPVVYNHWGEVECFSLQITNLATYNFCENVLKLLCHYNEIYCKSSSDWQVLLVLGGFFWKSVALFSVKNGLGYFSQLFDEIFRIVVFSFDSVRQNLVNPMLNNNEYITTGDIFFQFHLSTGIWCRSLCIDRNEKGFVVEIIGERYKPSGFFTSESAKLFLVIW